MASYSKLDKNNIREIAARFGIDVKQYDPINGGACNSSFLIKAEDNNDFVMTVFDEQDHTYISRYCKILEHLRENDFTTSKIVPLLEGDYVSDIFGKPVIMKTYLEGVVVKDLGEWMQFQIGEEMAKLHELPDAEFTPKFHPHGVQEYYKILGGNIDPEFENWIGEQIGAISSKIDHDLPRSLIHGDLFFDNVIFLDNGLVAFIDFVESCNYFKIFDLGMAVVGQCIDDEGKLSFKKVRALLSGYESIRKLRQAEKEAFQFFIEYAAITISVWRFGRYNVHKIIDDMRKDHLKMVKISKVINSISESDFKKYIFD